MFVGDDLLFLGATFFDFLADSLASLSASDSSDSLLFFFFLAGGPDERLPTDRRDGGAVFFGCGSASLSSSEGDGSSSLSETCLRLAALRVGCRPR